MNFQKPTISVVILAVLSLQHNGYDWLTESERRGMTGGAEEGGDLTTSTSEPA
jgi:hypothetical protein